MEISPMPLFLRARSTDRNVCFTRIAAEVPHFKRNAFPLAAVCGG